MLRSSLVALALLLLAATAHAHTYLVCKSGYPVTVVYNRIAGTMYYQVTFLHNNSLSNPKYGSCWWHDLIGGVYVDTLMSSSDPYTWRVPFSVFQSAVDVGVVTDGQGVVEVIGEQSARVLGTQYDSDGTQGYFWFPPQLTCGASADSDYGSLYDRNNNLRYYVYAPVASGNILTSTTLPFVVWPAP